MDIMDVETRSNDIQDVVLRRIVFSVVLNQRSSNPHTIDLMVNK